MSRVGKKPIEIPQGVEVTVAPRGKYGGQHISVKGPLGQLELDVRKGIECAVKDNTVVLERKGEQRNVRAYHGLYRSLVENMINGVTKGYEKKLEMVGIGFRAEVKGDILELTAGATHPYTVKAPEGITFTVDDRVNITVKGVDKQLVGQVSAGIRAIHKPEVYRGKGIRYEGEYVRRKAGKVAKAGEGGGE